LKILLIKPPLSRDLITLPRVEPLELEYLASAVKEHEVEILDMRIDKGLDKKLEQFRPNFVGISAYTCNVNVAKEILKEVKKFDIHIATAVGGHHATFLPDDFAFPFIDVLFLGMSDFTFKEYINIIEEGRDVMCVNNIALRKNDNLYFTEKKAIDIDLDSLPLPARHLTRQYRNKYHDSMRNRIALIHTTRGCPYRCVFCACWKIMDGKYVTRSPESIIEEFNKLPDDVDLVHFVDDNTLHSIKRAWRLCELLKERKIRKKFTMFARADTIVKHPDLIENLKDSGLEYLTVGIESYRDDELGVLNKKTSVQINNEAIRVLQKLGVGIAAHFMVNPNYTKEDFKHLLEYVCAMDLLRPTYSILTPLPGTELYFDNYDRFVIRNNDFFDCAHSVLPTKMDRKEFYSQFAKLYKKSYSFQRYFKSKLKDIRLLFMKLKDRILCNVDRISLFRLILIHIVTIPVYLRIKKNYKSEGLN